MALTAKGVWTPDGTGGYNEVVDLATMAASIDTALTSASNYGVGTTTQRTAGLTTATTGSVWYDTTIGETYRKVAGAWVQVGATSAGKYVSLTTAKSVANSTVATAGLTTPDYAYTEVSDLNAWHDPVTNPDRITPTLAGRYRVTVSGGWGSNGTGLRYYAIGVNGAYPGKYRIVVLASTDGNGASNLAPEIVMNGTTDYFTVQSYHTSGVALAMDLSVTVTYLGV